MAPKKHTWQLDERDALEIMYREYGYATVNNDGSESIINDDDAVAIFNHVFGWNAPTLRVREEWQFRKKDGRNLKWKSVHSKDSLDEYTDEEKDRRQEARVRILQAASELGINLTPIATFAVLHGAALATIAAPTNTGDPPDIAPALERHVLQASTSLASSSIGHPPATSALGYASQNTTTKQSEIPHIPASSQAAMVTTRTGNKGAADQDLVPVYEDIDLPGQFSAVPIFAGQAPHHYQCKSVNPHLLYTKENGRAVVRDKATGEEVTASRTQHTGPSSPIAPPASPLTPPNRNNNENDNIITVAGEEGAIVKQPDNIAAPGESGELWMVHYMNIHRNPARVGNPVATEPRFHCARTFKFIEGDTYEFGGQVMRILFDADNYLRAPRGQEDVMVCNRFYCDMCFPTEWDEQRKGESPTSGLPFVHSGQCKIRDDGELAHTPDLGRDYENGADCQIRKMKVRLFRGEDSAMFDCAVCVAESCIVCSANRTIVPSAKDYEEARSEHAGPSV